MLPLFYLYPHPTRGGFFQLRSAPNLSLISVIFLMTLPFPGFPNHLSKCIFKIVMYKLKLIRKLVFQIPTELNGLRMKWNTRIHSGGYPLRELKYTTKHPTWKCRRSSSFRNFLGNSRLQDGNGHQQTWWVLQLHLQVQCRHSLKECCFLCTLNFKKQISPLLDGPPFN